IRAGSSPCRRSAPTADRRRVEAAARCRPSRRPPHGVAAACGLIPVCCSTPATNRLTPWRYVLAADADEDEHGARRDREEDEGRAALDAEGKRAEVDGGAEPERPQERDEAVVERRRAGQVRHLQNSSRGERDGFHKLQGRLWKCG